MLQTRAFTGGTRVGEAERGTPTRFVKIVEVGPRDGLQNESMFIPTETKIDFINRLSHTGLKVVEATAFVSPKAIPQMKDAMEVYTKIKKEPGIGYPVLVPNLQGLESALKAGVQEIAVFSAASEEFNQRNINKSIDESLKVYQEVVKKALDSKIKVRGYVSCVLGCPYTGYVNPSKVAAVAKKLYDMGCYEISLGDTIGTGNPLSTKQMIDASKEQIPISALAVHFHDTYGQALSNILTAIQMGISVVDSSVAGMGGCPYARGATGNVATEDVLYMLNGMNINTNVDIEKLVDVGNFISQAIGRENRSKAAVAISRKREAKKT